jgi:hypothetical protein
MADQAGDWSCADNREDGHIADRDKGEMYPAKQQSAPRKTSAEAVPKARRSAQRQQQFKPVQARIVKVRRQPLLDLCGDSRRREKIRNDVPMKLNPVWVRECGGQASKSYEGKPKRPVLIFTPFFPVASNPCLYTFAGTPNTQDQQARKETRVEVHPKEH